MSCTLPHTPKHSPLQLKILSPVLFLFTKSVRHKPAEVTVSIPVLVSECNSFGQSIQIEGSAEPILSHLHLGFQIEASDSHLHLSFSYLEFCYFLCLLGTWKLSNPLKEQHFHTATWIYFRILLQYFSSYISFLGPKLRKSTQPPWAPT